MLSIYDIVICEITKTGRDWKGEVYEPMEYRFL